MKKQSKVKEFSIFHLDEFCQDRACPVFKSKKEDPSQIEICKTVCNFTAYELQQWISSNGYSIVKNKLLSKFIDANNNV